MTSKQLTYFYTFVEIVKIWAEQEVGDCEVDIDKIADYVSSDRFFVDSFSNKTKESFEEDITNDILKGLPIWGFLKVSDWTKKMLARSFEDQCKIEDKKIRKKYICLQECQFYECSETSIGTFERCIYKDSNPNPRYRNHPRIPTPFRYKCKCKNYHKKEG